MTATMNWLRQTRRTYFGNAAAQRDYRVQLRGNRSMLLFGLYLAILIGVGCFKYATIAGSTMSVVAAQRELRDFYALVVFLLGGVVSIVTPGLASTAIVLERQRRSLDLVFSAPVEPRYYLVGKAIGVYRYVWMLLILSLPVTAACVVLGGASWGDVLTAYGLLSIHGLLFAAIGLLVSSLSTKPVSAVVWTYAAVAAYLCASGGAAAAAYGDAHSYYRMNMPGEASFFIALNPFSTLFTVGTHTSVMGHSVPNVVLGAAAILVAVRLCLLGAGSAMSEGRETANLRLHWALVTGATAFGLAYWLVSSGGYATITMNERMGPDGTAYALPLTTARGIVLGYGLFWLLSPLVLALPMLVAYGSDGAQRQRANGGFAFRRAFDGSPAGALPYVMLLVALASGCGLAGVGAAGGGLPPLAFGAYVLYALGFWSFFWAIGRVASSYGMGLRAARTSLAAAFVVLVGLPVPFLVAFAGARSFGSSGSTSAWDLYLLRPVLQFDGVNLALPVVYGAGLLALAFGMNAWSERNRLRNVAVRA